MNSLENRERLLAGYIRAARLLMECALAEWADEHGDQAINLLAEISNGRRSLDLVMTAFPSPNVQIVSVGLDETREHQVLVKFVADTSEMH